MWVVAGVLLGLVVMAIVAGWHVGPHAHALAAVLGALAASWLIAMVAIGDARPLLYVLLGADLAVSAGVGAAAWKGLQHQRDVRGPMRSLHSAMGVAVTDLKPEGIVRVKGETWSATSLNGEQPAGTLIQVISVRGIRLEVWGEEPAENDAPLELIEPPPQTPSPESTTPNVENRSNAS